MAVDWKGVFSLSFRRKLPDGPRRGIGFSAGVHVGSDSSMKVSAFNRGVIYISTQIAKLPWDVKDSQNNIQEGGISNLLNLSPNEEMNAFQFRLYMIQTAIKEGNSFAEIERDLQGRPIAIWPIPHEDVDLVRSPDGKLWYRVTGASSYGGEVYLRPRDVFHVRNFHTKDGLIGQGVVAYAMETLGISISADRLAGGLFANSGIPSGVLIHPGRLTDEAYERLKASWKEQHGGRKTGGTSILEEGTKYEPINMDPVALQFLESRKFGVLEIARFLGLPPTKLFDITAATYSNVENANLEVATDTLDAWACNLEIEADVKILSNRFGGRYSELDLYSVFRGDMGTRSKYFATMMQIGAITPNQIRAREGQAPYPQGNEYYIARNNYTPASRLNEVIDAEIKSKEPVKPTPVEPTEDEKEVNNALVKYLTKV